MYKIDKRGPGEGWVKNRSLGNNRNLHVNVHRRKKLKFVLILSLNVLNEQYEMGNIRESVLT